MKFGMMLLAAGLFTGAATAATAAPGLSAKGDGRWEVQCRTVADGEAKTVILAPDTSAYAHPKLVRASCDYRASASGELTISVIGASACPFAGASAEACTLTAPKSKRGSFSFKTAPAR
jgi:hypothetical protein